MYLVVRFKYFFKYYLLLLLCVSTVGYSQPTDPSTDPDAVPITGIEILIGAGALLGAKRFLDKRKK
jgi:hypothetical protein